MKKLTGIIISIIMLMTLFSVMSSAEDLVVLRSIRDLTKYTTESLRDESSDAGAIYGLSDPAAFKIELVNEGSKPLIKYTVNGGQTQHFHDKLNLKAEGSMNIFAEGPEAFRFYVKT